MIKIKNERDFKKKCKWLDKVRANLDNINDEEDLEYALEVLRATKKWAEEDLKKYK